MTAQGQLSLVAEPATPEFGRDLLACLRQYPHIIEPKYFYDEIGSALFEHICSLPEYYLTRTETAILADAAAEMADLIGPDATIVEFGAGSLVKTRLLLDALNAPCRFAPVDISGEHLTRVAAVLREDYPGLEVMPVVADFTEPERLPVWRQEGRPWVGFFPGSTLGNLSRSQARRFLSTTARLLRGGGLLIGVDLVKDPLVLHAAYNDAAGVTAAFNRNLLARANRQLGSDFDVAVWQHYAFYNVPEERIEMHLVVREPQNVSILGQRFVLRRGESIRTEISQKYTVESFRTLAAACGFHPRGLWCDPDNLFSVHWLVSVG